MDIDSVVGQINAMVYGQLRMAGDDPAIEAAGEAILASIDRGVPGDTNLCHLWGNEDCYWRFRPYDGVGTCALQHPCRQCGGV